MAVKNTKDDAVKVKISSNAQQKQKNDEIAVKEDALKEAALDTEIEEKCDIKPPEKDEALSKSLEEKDKELEESRERLLRVCAEFENYKKRAQREVDDFRKFAYENFAKEMLPVIDNLERALETSGENDEVVKSIVQGVNMTLKEMRKVLAKFGIKPIESIGKAFDPTFHQAMSQEESSEYPANTVTREFQRGYMIRKRLLRPAMVVVSKGNSEENSKKNK